MLHRIMKTFVLFMLVGSLTLNTAQAGCFGSNPEKQIFKAVSARRISQVMKLLPSVDPDTIYNGTPLLHAAVQTGNPKIVEAIIERNPNLNATNSAEETALLLASRIGNVEIVKLLIENSADPTIKDKNGQTPLLVASVYGHLTIVKILLKREDVQKNVDFRDVDNATPLMGAAAHGFKNKEVAFEISKLLLDNGADVNAKSEIETSKTPLGIALSTQNAKLASLFIEKGADLSDGLKDLSEFQADVLKKAMEIAKQKKENEVTVFDFFPAAKAVLSVTTGITLPSPL